VVEAKGKYGGLLFEIRQERAQPEPAKGLTTSLSLKPSAPAGKRSDPCLSRNVYFCGKRLFDNRVSGSKGEVTRLTLAVVRVLTG
jgi:hypothetical protein